MRDAPPQRRLELEEPVGRARSRRGAAARRRSTASSCASAGSQLRPRRPCSSERSAFCSDSGNVRPMAIASPTDCICVPSTPVVPGNFSNAQRGILVTT